MPHLTNKLILFVNAWLTIESFRYHDWKYGMFVDYVELVPITMDEFNAAKRDGDVVMKDISANMTTQVNEARLEWNKEDLSAEPKLKS